MTTHDTPWPAGTPCWVDLMASDLDRTHDFYAALLGWTYEPGIAEYGGYHNALLDDRRVAGLSPTLPGMENAPRAWTVYLASDDIAATRAAVVEHGGQVVSEPMQVGDFGSMGVFTDPTGAAFGVWQAGTHTGITVVGEPGTPMWMDLMTSPIPVALDFYAAAFGFAYTDASSVGMSYAMFTVPGGIRPAGGIGEVSGDDPAAVRGWTVCFQVSDVDDVVRRLPEAGGTVVTEPYDFTYGRLAAATGPDGEMVYLMTPQAM